MELRNEFLLISDGEPYSSTTTPWFAVSDGEDYLNVVYMVDSAVETTFSYGGGQWTESPYMANVTGVGAQAASTSAMMSMTFDSKSLRMTKLITLADGSDSVQVEYDVVPLIDAQLNSTQLPIWVPFGSSVSEPLYYLGIYHLTVNSVPLEITTSGNVSVGTDAQGGQQRIMCTFTPTDNKITAKVTLTFPSAQKSLWGLGLWAQTSDGLVRQYNVSYIVMEKPIDDYVRLLQDSRMQVAYENTLFIIFKVI
jgi:hypothetical protein